MKLIDVLVGKSAFEHVYGKGAIQVKYIIIIIIIKIKNLNLSHSIASTVLTKQTELQDTYKII